MGPPPPRGAPTANFTASPTSGPAPLTVSFQDTSTGSPTSWAWDFQNDGVVDSTQQNPQFTYTTPGSHTVKLTATNANGSDDEVKTDFITVTGAPPPSGELTFPAVADAKVNSASANTNYGLDTTLRVKTESSTYWSYMKFDVSVPAGATVTAAKLRVQAIPEDSGSPDSGDAFAVGNSTWIESEAGSITWNNKPALGAKIGEGKAVAPGTIDIPLQATSFNTAAPWPATA